MPQEPEGCHIKLVLIVMPLKASIPNTGSQFVQIFLILEKKCIKSYILRYKKITIISCQMRSSSDKQFTQGWMGIEKENSLQIQSNIFAIMKFVKNDVAEINIYCEKQETHE